MKARFLLRIDEDLKAKLITISEIERRSLTSQIIKILDNYCKSWEKENER